MFLKVSQKKQETENVFSLIFEKPNGFKFYSGQYLDIELPVDDKYGGNTRAFSISSSPTEDFLMVTPKKGISEFKKFMEKLNVGDTITTSHPVGTFTLDESSPAIFIAGGIGITPFRSMVKYAVDQSLDTPITLFYSNSDDNFLFKSQLDEWQKKLPNLTIHYVITSESGHLDKESFLKLYPILYTLYPKNYSPQASLIYYLAGPPEMVDDLAKILIDLGLDETDIRYDRFDGY